MGWIENLIKRLAMDRAIAYVLINRAWAALAGPVTLAVVVVTLNPVEQGFYFAFASVLAASVFFELGLGFVILQTASHRSAPLRWEGTRLTGSIQAQAELGALLRWLCQWFGVMALLFVMVVGAVGQLLFERDAAGVAWQSAWHLATVLFGLGLLVVALLNFLEGIGQVAQVALVRLFQLLSSTLALWAALVSGWKLGSVAVMHGVSLLVGLTWIVIAHRRQLLALWRMPSTMALQRDWRTEIWPMQWRIALSWMAGYLATQSLTLGAFRFFGPQAAGQVGLTMAVLAALTSAALAWTSTKAARFGRLAALQQHAELFASHRAAKSRTLAVGSAGILLMLCLAIILGQLDPHLADRFVPVPWMLALCIGSFAALAISTDALLLRSFRQEPYAWLSLAAGGCVFAGVLLAGWLRSLPIMFSLYAVVFMLVWLLWARPMATRFVAAHV